MKCPNDKSEMMKGLIDRGIWIEIQKTSSIGLSIQKLFQPSSQLVISWRCPKCGKVEQYIHKEE